MQIINIYIVNFYILSSQNIWKSVWVMSYVPFIIHASLRNKSYLTLCLRATQRSVSKLKLFPNMFYIVLMTEREPFNMLLIQMEEMCYWLCLQYQNTHLPFNQFWKNNQFLDGMKCSWKLKRMYAILSI